MRFAEIIGQMQTKNYLVNTVLSNRVSHAQLFAGGEGCGKLALAVAYAQFISCRNRQTGPFEDGLTADSCGTCPSCLKYAKLAHPDLHFYYPVATTKDVKSKPRSIDFIGQFREYFLTNQGYISLAGWFDTIGIENKQGIINAEDCDELVRKLGLKSYESEYKVVIIWMAEKLYHAAAPKILKILEEPPDKTLFILVAGNPEQLINTIVSRTQLVRIPKLTDRDIAHALAGRKQTGEIEARRISARANGDYTLAVQMLNEDADESYNFNTLRNWLRICYRMSNEDGLELVKLADSWSKIGREKQKSFLQYALKVVRNLTLISYGNQKLVKTDEEEGNFVGKLAPAIRPEAIPRMAGEFNKAIFHIERNANARILFFDLSLTLNGIMR